MAQMSPPCAACGLLPWREMMTLSSFSACWKLATKRSLSCSSNEAAVRQQQQQHMSGGLAAAGSRGAGLP